MRKFLFGFLLFLLLLVISPRVSFASLISIKSDGSVEWKVLSIQDELALGITERNYLEVKEITPTSGDTDSLIVLKKEDGKTILLVGTTTDGLDVTGWEDTLVEVEERGDVRKINIKLVEGKFAIEQDGIVAITELPININPQSNEFSLTTPSGAIFLSVLPIEAAESALRSRYVSKLSDEKIEISEKETGVLTYLVDGEKTINLFNIINYGVPVTAYISTSTGEILFVDQPAWLRALGFLFS